MDSGQAIGALLDSSFIANRNIIGDLNGLPEGWQTTTLGSVATVKYGKAKPKETGDIPAVGSGGIYALVDRPLIDFPTIIVGRKGAAGSVWLQKQPSWPSDTTFFLAQISAQIDVTFLYYQMLSRPLSGEHAKTTMPSLQKPDLEGYVLNLPPLPEQHAIAHTLRTIQQATGATESVIAATRELKQSLMHHLFTYGPVPVSDAGQVPLKETEVGRVPEHWDVGSLSDYLREPLKNGHSAPEVTSGNGVPTLTLSAVTLNDFSSRHVKITSADTSKVADLWLKSGDLLIERANTKELVGISALYEGPEDFAIYPDLMVRVRVDESRLHPKFLAEYLRTPVARNYFRQNARGTAGNMPKINQGVIQQLRVPVPPTAEQRRIAANLRVLDRKIEVEESRRHALDVVFQSLLHHLMTGRLRAGVNMLEFA